jgi:SET domain-containing protein
VNIPVWIGRSRIAGKGLFTAQDIPQDTKMIPYRGEEITKEESTKRLTRGHDSILPFNTRWDIDGKPLYKKARYLNHACDPHCTVHLTTRTRWIVAGRDSTAGEALTSKYGYERDEQDAPPCTCGAQQCCGFLLAPPSWDLLRNKAAAS